MHSSFQALRMREIAFRVFGNPYTEDIKSDKFPVKVLDMYPMTEPVFEFFESGNIHPPSGWMNKATSEA